MIEDVEDVMERVSELYINAGYILGALEALHHQLEQELEDDE